MTPTTVPRRAGVLGALALAADTADEIVLGTVRDVHGAVATRVHTLIGRRPGTGPVTTAVYDGIGCGLRATSRGLRAADHRVGARIEESPARSRAGLRRQRPDRRPARRGGLGAGDQHGGPGGPPRRGHRRVLAGRGVPATPRATSRSSCTACASPRPRGVGARTSAAAATATGSRSRAGRRSTCARTPGCRSPRTASPSPPCSTTWWPPGRPPYVGSRWSGTRWAGSSCGPRAPSRPTRRSAGPTW